MLVAWWQNASMLGAQHSLQNALMCTNLGSHTIKNFFRLWYDSKVDGKYYVQLNMCMYVHNEIKTM